MTRERYPHLLLRHIEEVRASQEFVSRMLAMTAPEQPHCDAAALVCERL